jgi:YidC/Oxa1 family membrane protein insertase
MDYIKISLIGLVAVIAYYLLLQWPPSPVEGSINPIVSQETPITSHETPATSRDPVKAIPLNENVFIDSEPSLTDLGNLSSSGGSSKPIQKTEVGQRRVFSITNDVLNIEIDAITGRFVKADMKDIKVQKGEDESISLFGSRLIEVEDACPVGLGAVQKETECVGSYFASSGFYSYSNSTYLNPNFLSIEKMTVDEGGSFFTLKGENNGLYFTRRVWLKPGEYSLVVEDLVVPKGGSEPINVVPYALIVRDGYRPPGRFLDFDSYTYLGPVFSTEYDSFGKLDFSDVQEDSFEKASSGGWLAVVQRYFVSSWIPEQGEKYTYQAQQIPSGVFSIALAGRNRPISEGTSASNKNTLYVGPKISDNLNKVHPDLGLVVDYGFLWWLSEPIHKLMTWGYGFLGNWGLAILFATLVLKALLWPLSAAGYRSAAKMRAVAPQMAELQQKHANDKQKLGQEMMAFYKKEGVSPLGGCLPMLLQMPFFLAFYWVLLDMVELRHAPFLLWITDLSSYDPFFVLPLLNAGLMYYSQKMMPVTPSSDPTQQQMQSAMKFMPIMIAAMFCIFPAGFVLYFTIQSLITVIQQALSFRKAGISLKSV